MSYKIERVDVWAVDTVNRPGMLARLLEAVSHAGGQLEFLVARQVTANTSRVFLAPIKGVRQKTAAQDVGLSPARGMFAFRVVGPDVPGLGARITRAVAAKGINLRGASAAGMAKKVMLYLACASEADMIAAMKAAKAALRKKAR